MKTPSSILIIIAFALLLAGGTVQAATTNTNAFVNFEHMTVGNAVVASLPVAGELPTTNATRYNFATNAVNTTINVSNNFTSTISNVPFGSGHVMVYDRPTNASGSTYIYFGNTNTDAFTNGIVVYQFDFMRDDGVTYSGNFFMGMRDTNYATSTGLMLASNGNFSLSGYSAPNTPSGTSTNLGTLALATSYKIKLEYNYNTGVVDAYLNGSYAGTQPFATNAGFLEAYFGTSVGTLGRFAVDNVTIEQIPEPSTLSLAFLALMGGFLAIRYRHSRADRHA